MVKSGAGKVTMWKRRLPLRIIRALNRARYLVTTRKKADFAEKLYRSEYLLSHVTRFYPPLLKLIWKLPDSLRAKIAEVIGEALGETCLVY